MLSKLSFQKSHKTKIMGIDEISEVESKVVITNPPSIPNYKAGSLNHWGKMVWRIGTVPNSELTRPQSWRHYYCIFCECTIDCWSQVKGALDQEDWTKMNMFLVFVLSKDYEARWEINLGGGVDSTVFAWCG